MAATSANLLVEIASLLSKSKLIPFFGAGVSRQHLGFAAAGLASEMAVAIGYPEDTRLCDLADAFLDRCGSASYIKFLEDKLVVKDFDERKATSHRLLISLMQNLLYTTNQDNLFELTAYKYGRQYKSIVTIDDLSDASPGDPLLIKFHGDLSVPDSLVFGTKSYLKRMETKDHPLDIKLRADLLGKRLLFIGYSLQDENVKKIFDTVKRAFGGTLPNSYLIAYDNDPQLIAAAEEYQVKIAVPTDLYPSLSQPDAFERFLQDLCNETRKLQVKKGISDLFSTGHVNPAMITDFEFNAASNAVSDASFSDAVDVFRTTFDQAVIPEHLHQTVVDLYAKLLSRADPSKAEEMDSLKAILFHLRIPPVHALSATAHFMASCNKRPMKNGFDNYGSLLCPALPDGSMPIAAAAAVAILADRHEVVTDSFREVARWWFRDYDKVQDSINGAVQTMIKHAWPGHLEAESPINRPLHSFGLNKGYHQILAELKDKFPKHLKSPHE